MLRLTQLEIGYAGHALVKLPDTTVVPGEFICLLGRNGQGKSTLLRTLAGFIPACAGQVSLHGRPLGAMSGAMRARHVGVVLTERPQLPGMRVRELVELGRQPHTGWSGVLGSEDRAIAAQALELVGGMHLAPRDVDSLSDGERQRAMVARALAQQPDVLLLDEITSFLDLPSRVTIIDTLRRVAKQGRVAVILSSHDLELSLQTADRLWLLPGEGRFVDGAPEDVVLSGAIGRAFDQQNLAFSQDTGRFERPPKGSCSVYVHGDDRGTAWLSRALLRCGYATVSEPEQALHSLSRTSDGWTLAEGGHATNIAGVLELLTEARRQSGEVS